MQIVKDVMIAGPIEPVWDSVVSHSQAGLAEAGRCPSPGEAFETDPPNRLAYRSADADLPIVTTIEISRKGKRTGLRVTVTGWEAVGPDRARAEMPRLSLEWERTLARIKKEIESPGR